MNADTLKLETLRLVKLDHIIENVAEDGYKSLRKALDEEKEGIEKNKAILKSLHETKQKLFRLDVLLQWSHKAAASLQCKRVLDVCRQDGEGLVSSADQLAYLHSELLHSRMPPFDVSLSQRMLLEHRFDILPRIIWSELQLPYSMSIEDGALSKAEALRRIYFLSKIKLVHDKLPIGVNVSCDRKLGVVMVESVLGQYQAELGLVPGPSPLVVLKKWSNDDRQGGLEEISENDTTLFWRWRLISCKVLPRIRPNPVSQGTMDIIRQNAEDRMWVSSDYQILKRFDAQNSLKFTNPSALSEDQNDNGMQMPGWIESPFYALDSILKHISGKVAVGILFLDAAKRLINSKWRGCLKFGKLPDSDGLRLEFWNGNYMLSYSDLQRLKGGSLNHLNESEETTRENSGVIFDIKVSKSGAMTANQFPDVASSIPPEELCLANMDGAVDLNSLILKAARRFSSLQLQGIEVMIKKELEKRDSNFSQNSDIVLMHGDSDSRSVDWHESPRLNLRTGLATILSLKVHLRTGFPIISGGFFVLEDGVYRTRATEKIKIVRNRLQVELLDLSKRSTVKAGRKCIEYCKIISDMIVILWMELVSGIFIAHKLNNTPFDSLEMCKMPSAISMPRNEHFECYKLLNDASSHATNKTGQKSSLDGYILVGMSLGAMRLEKVLLCILPELTGPGANLAINMDVIVKEVPNISSIINRDDTTKVSGAQKRSRNDDVLKRFQVRQDLPKDSWDCLNQIISWSKSTLLEKKAILQFHRARIEYNRVESSEQLEFTTKVPVSELNLPEAFASNEIQMNIVPGEALTKVHMENNWLSQWPESLTGDPVSLNLLKQRSSYCLTDGVASVVAVRDSCCVFECKGFPDDVVEKCVRFIKRVIRLQRFVLVLLSNVLDTSLNYRLKANSNLIVSLDSLSLDSIALKYVWNEPVAGVDFDAKCTIFYQEQDVCKVDQNARASNLSGWSTALSSTRCPSWIKAYIDQMVQSALSSTSESRTTIASFLEGVGALLCIGNSLETRIFDAKDLSECGLYKNVMKIEHSEVHCDTSESKYYVTFKMTLNEAARGMALAAKASLTDSSLVCSPIPHVTTGDSFGWFLELWDMMAMETECTIAKTYQENLPIITAEQADIHNLVHLLHECCFSIAGLR